MSLKEGDVSIVTARRLEEDEDLGLTLDNTNFIAKDVRKGRVHGIDGAFVLTHTMTRDECDEVKKHMFGDPNKLHHHKEPVFFRKWAEDREAEERKLGWRYITQSQV